MNDRGGEVKEKVAMELGFGPQAWRTPARGSTANGKHHKNGGGYMYGRENKAIAALAALLMLLFVGVGAWAGAKVEDSQTTGSGGVRMNGLPIVDEMITLNGFGSYHPQQGPFEDMLFFQEMERRTNIHIEWELAPDAASLERQNLKLATGDLPDIFFRMDMSDLDLLKWGSGGVFVDMNKYTDYSPNLNLIFAEHPEWKIESADGGKYALSNIQELGLNRSHRLWVNQKWLDALDLPMPTTTEEYLETLIAFRDKDPNGNGKQDEVGLADFSTGTGRYVLGFMGAFGLGTRGPGFYGQTGMDIGPDGNLRYIPIDSRYKEVLQFLNTLWEEDLIDPDHFAHSVPDWQALGATDRLGSHFQTSPAFMKPNDVDFAYALPLIGPHGDQLYAAINPDVVQRSVFAFTSANPYPEATMRWVDYLYSFEGTVLLDWGVEGVTYTVDANGKWDAIRDDPSDRLSPVIWDPESTSDWPNKGTRGVWTPFHGGRTPILWSTDYWNSTPRKYMDDNAVRNFESLEAYGPYYPNPAWSALALTPEEAQTIADYNAETGQYIAEMQAQFITGQLPFSEWNTYVSKVKSGNHNAFIQAVTSAYNRFIGK
jgi:putative aldouronate transport system substrate-binding protein